MNLGVDAGRVYVKVAEAGDDHPRRAVRLRAGETYDGEPARTVLAAFKVPVRVEIVDALPRSTIEKLARPRLRERALALVKGESA